MHYWLGKFLKLISHSKSSDKDSCNINLYDGRGGTDILRTIHTLHTSPVHLMKFNPIFNVVLSSDEHGSLEYWTPDVSPISAVEGDDGGDSFEDFNAVEHIPKTKGFIEVSDFAKSWKYKSETDLYEFKKVRKIFILIIG